MHLYLMNSLFQSSEGGVDLTTLTIFGAPMFLYLMNLLFQSEGGVDLTTPQLISERVGFELTIFLEPLVGNSWSPGGIGLSG